VKLALFDLDHTLLDGDSDALWGRFLVQEGVVDGEHYLRENARYYAEYRAGRLDIHEFMAFGLRPLLAHAPARLQAWRQRFVAECILPRIPRGARELLHRHAAAGHTLVIVTATNDFITTPIAAELGVPHLIATELERDGERYTGRAVGPPCFREGKVLRFEAWLARKAWTAEETWFYSDSHNDLPLLQRVQHPVAVNPDDILAHTAHECGWPVLQLRCTDSADAA
jgi:HAD superfamily hydrolase (TIGR01490 family)